MNVITFEVDRAHLCMLIISEDILVLGGPTQGLDDTTLNSRRKISY